MKEKGCGCEIDCDSWGNPILCGEYTALCNKCYEKCSKDNSPQKNVATKVVSPPEDTSLSDEIFHYGLQEWTATGSPVVMVEDIKKAVKRYISEDWELFMRFLDNEFSFLELANKRLKLQNKIFGDKLI